jgi:D-alanyl-D-alanine carboxypeptidase/D-alanyl-D-alanine-endopeptidase (penicillin-binding protein 4)
MKLVKNKGLFLLVLGQVFFLSCFRLNQDSPAGQTNFEVLPPNINLTRPLEVSQRPEDVQLAKEIEQMIENSEFANARWGIFVVSLRDGRVLVAKEAQKLFNPASTQKILTSIVALDKLGADFRWETRIFSKSRIENGILNGDLILYGQGAPDLSDEGIENLANQLKAKGLTKIKGNIIGDESYFKGDNIGDGWTWNEIQWYYGAEASALSVNLNYVNVGLQNGKPQASNAVMQVSGEIKPAQDLESVGVKRELGANQVYFYGEGKTLDVRIAVQNPALWAAKILKDTLQKKGVGVDGEAKSADWKSTEKFAPEATTELARVESKTLGEIVRKMNKDSVNLYAELILRTLGKRFGESAPDENPKMQKVRGDDAAGASVIKKWLTENNIATEEIKIHDGSGLSRLDLVTPEVLGRALIFAAQSKFADIFRNSLPVAGTDGTLRGRLGRASGKVVAKTGSIMYVNTLAGYAVNPRETLAFVILCNNQTRRNDSLIVVDEIALKLTE